MYTNKTLFNTFRGGLFLDGGLGGFFPAVEGVAGVTVAPFPRATLSTMGIRVDISCDDAPGFPYSLPVLIRHALVPPEGAVLRDLANHGAAAAAAYAESNARR